MNERRFYLDPATLARLEAGGWRAYYDRAWLRLLYLLVILCQIQFGIRFPRSLLAAYYTMRASMAWAPADNDPSAAKDWYARFYRIAAASSGLDFDPERAAALELQYNDDHRRLVHRPDKSDFIETLTQLHSLLFNLSPVQARPSAELRVQAANTVDLITGGLSTDIEADWARVEEYLRRAYIAVDLAKRAAEAGKDPETHRYKTSQMGV